MLIQMGTVQNVCNMKKKWKEEEEEDSHVNITKGRVIAHILKLLQHGSQLLPFDYWI